MYTRFNSEIDNFRKKSTPLLFVLQKPILIAGGKKFHQFLRDQCPVVSETYYPTFWCWESRVQTLLRPFVTAKPWVSYRK